MIKYECEIVSIVYLTYRIGATQIRSGNGIVEAHCCSTTSVHIEASIEIATQSAAQLLVDSAIELNVRDARWHCTTDTACADIAWRTYYIDCCNITDEG